MKAEDTVIPWDKIVKLTGFVSDVDSHPAKRLRELAQAQAEISFKAGVDEEAKGCVERCALTYQDGIREVVDAIRIYNKNYTNNDWGDKKFRNSVLWWLNSQLKEWGVK